MEQLCQAWAPVAARTLELLKMLRHREQQPDPCGVSALAEVSLSLLRDQAAISDLAASAQTRAWLLFTVADGSSSQSDTILQLGHVSPFQEIHHADTGVQVIQGAGGSLHSHAASQATHMKAAWARHCKRCCHAKA